MATASSNEKRELARERGAEETYDYESFAEQARAGVLERLIEERRHGGKVVLVP